MRRKGAVATARPPHRPPPRGRLYKDVAVPMRAARDAAEQPQRVVADCKVGVVIYGEGDRECNGDSDSAWQ